MEASPLDSERTSGSAGYLAVLGRLHHDLAPRLYVEIGVRAGDSLALATGPAIGVDPFPKLTAALPAAARVVADTSDRFFEGEAGTTLAGGIDLAFIDGLHWFEQSLRDFIHLERHANPSALVVIDDIFPNHPLQANRERQTQVWTGDVWKMPGCLRAHRPDLVIVTLDASPAGLMLVAGLDGTARLLRDHYDSIVQQSTATTAAVPPSVLSREGAWSPDDVRVGSLLRLLRETRDAGTDVAGVRERLRVWRARPTEPHTT